MVVTLMTVNAQTALKKVYDESIDPMEQIDKALAVAKSDGKFVMCQVGGNPARFGFPVFVVLDANGKVLHTQDSSFLEEDKGYSEKKVLRFFKNWTPAAVKKH